MTDSSLQLRRVSPHVGAEVSGITLGGDLSRQTVSALHDALATYHVLFFRDQAITPAAQVAFAKRLGRLRRATRASFSVVEGVPELSVLEMNREKPPNIDHYHPDGIFRAQPEFASILRAVVVPEVGGDTIFTSLTAAYDALSETMKDNLADKRAVHDFMRLHGSPRKSRSWKGDGADGMAKARDANPPVAHDLVRTHPVTGRKHLYLAEVFTTHIEDLPAFESDGLLNFLVKHACKPEFQYRFQWTPDAIAMWDNRASMHYAVADYWPDQRLMHRLTIETDDLGADAYDQLGT